MQKLYDAMRLLGIPMPNKDTDTGLIIRWGRNNRYWLKKFEGGYVFGDFVTDQSSHVFEQEYRGKKLAQYREKMQKALRDVEVKSSKMHEMASTKASFILTSAQHTSQNRYLERKKVRLHDLKSYKNYLIVPACDNNGKIWTLQFIDMDGNKRFLSGGKKKGCYYTIGSLDDVEKIFICEGYATGATIYECTEVPVIVAFDAGNLSSVAQAIREKYQNIKIVICADNDQYGSINTGLEKAKEAAASVGGSIVVPKFKDTSTHPTDFNDLFVLEGKDSVVSALKEQMQEETTSEKFISSAQGLFWVDSKGKMSRLSNYINVTAFVRSDNGISKLVEFKDYKNEMQQLIVKPNMIVRDGEQIRVLLTNQGFVYAGTPLSKRKLFEYIMSASPTKEATLITRAGFFRSIYIRSDVVIGASEEKIIPDDSIRNKAVASTGSLQEWNDYIARYCIGNSRLILAINAAFASMLLKSCGMPNFGFHFVGNSSSGKTTCLNIAASIFGKPEYVVTWKATDNALENVAYKHNDALLILDELSEISPTKAGEVAYMLGNGQGKKRLDKNCNARETLSWRLIFLSSGEVDLTSHMAENSRTSKAGQKVRLLNVPSKACENSFGIFENLHDFKDGAEFSNFLRTNAARYYGTPAIAFIEKVLMSTNEIRQKFQEEFQNLKTQYLPIKAEGQDQRAFEHFMFAGFAGELAIKYDIVDWKPGTAYAAAIACFNSWLEDKDGVGDDENRQILEQVKAFFELHGHSRFFDLDGFKDQKIANMAGYKTVYKDAVTFFVSPSAFQNEICRNFTRKSVINLLIEKGFLLKDHNGDYRQQKWTPDGNKKVYVISGKILL